jgi:hypothetical protein
VLSEEDVRSWAVDQRVFISSMMAGMRPERAAVAEAVERVGAEAVWFEQFGGRDDNPEVAYLSEVAACDVYLGILGQRYGTPLTTGYSATHAEYREAVERGLRVSVWVHDGPLDGPQQDFLNAVQVFRTTGSYTSPGDLADGVTRRLRALAAEELSPWVKLDHVVFRARRVVFDGTRLVIEARVRDDAVLAALEAMRPDGTWRTAQEVVATWRGRTTAVRLETVRTETTAGRGGVVTIEAGRVEHSGSSSWVTDMSTSGYSAEDLTELAVRVALFGEPNPLREMSFLAKIDDPFEELDGLRLPADAVEPVARLLLTESLVGTGRAERITHLDVGPAHLGRRRIALGWEPRRRYTNVTPEPRHIEGDVTIRPPT